MSNAQTNKDVALRYVEELWSQGNLDVEDEIISAEPEDVRGINTGTALEPEGTKAMVAGVRSPLPGLTREIHSITADEEHVSIN